MKTQAKKQTVPFIEKRSMKLHLSIQKNVWIQKEGADRHIG